MSNFYRRLAFTNIKNNKQFYLPYMLTSIVSVMLFYCMNALSLNDGFKHVRGAGEVIMVMQLGVIIIGIFVTILLFYTNSFIMKRRKKELGVYNILGMEKKHLAKVLFWETLTSYIVSIVAGLVCGIVFQKYFSMILYKITGLDEYVPFSISGTACLITIVLFCGIYILNLLYNILQIKLAKPVELLHSSSTGEREPKTKIFMTIIGVVSLAAGYFIALSTKDPVSAIFMFFVAVILVIIGTYALFTSGSIALLKLLRKNKNYYYQTRHFTSVSGMLYRMKQNAVGLGNICILSTMVLVVLSTTTSMYIGLNDLVNSVIPTDISVRVDFKGVPEKTTTDHLEELVRKSIVSQGRTITDNKSEINFAFIGLLYEDELVYGGSVDGFVDYKESSYVRLMTKSECERERKISLPELADNQIAVLSSNKYENTTLIMHGLTYEVVYADTIAEEDGVGVSSLIKDNIIIVVKENAQLKEMYGVLAAVHIPTSIIPSPFISYNVNYDTDGTKEEQQAAVNAINADAANWNMESDVDWEFNGVDSKVQYYQQYLMMHGGIFFLGLFLGLMFLMITVLIIYYKQISEGYEDRERFVIMQKVGMSNQEVKATIRSQVRTVFFLPLVTANIHLLAAFPMLMKILNLMFISNTVIFAECLIGTIIVFAIIYYIVFKITSRSYYKIVGNQI